MEVERSAEMDTARSYITGENFAEVEYKFQIISEQWEVVSFE